MSAFIVEEKTLNNIVSFLDYDTRFSNQSGCYGSLGKVMKKAGYDLNFAEHKDRLIKEMAWMNRAAVNARYEEEKHEEYLSYQDTFPPSRIQAYKSLCCYLYQCCEGDVPDQPLYKAFREIRSDLAEVIVSDLPEYNEANWG